MLGFRNFNFFCNIFSAGSYTEDGEGCDVRTQYVEKVTGQELKEILKGEKLSSGKEVGGYAQKITNKYKEAIEKLSDDAEFNAEGLREFMKKNSEVYKKSKKCIQELINALPKLRGKYAAIYAGIGAAVMGALAYITSPQLSTIIHRKEV